MRSGGRGGKCGGGLGGGFEGEDLGLAGVVDGFAEDAGGFLGGVKAHGVFGGDEVEAPLGFAMEFA